MTIAELDVFPIPLLDYNGRRYWWSSPFGPRWGGHHGGVDLACAGGTPILAPVGGLLNQWWDPGGGGNWSNLWTPGGDLLGFGHARAYYDPDGSGPATSLNGWTVEAGQVIAYVGTTGASTGDHLHFAYKPRGASAYVDPAPLLRAAEAAGRFIDNPTTPGEIMPTDAEIADAMLDRLNVDDPKTSEFRSKLAREVLFGLSGWAAAQSLPWANDPNGAPFLTLDKLAERINLGTLGVGVKILGAIAELTPAGGEPPTEQSIAELAEAIAELPDDVVDTIATRLGARPAA